MVSDGTGSFTGFDEGLTRNTAATMITRMMMPPMMIQDGISSTFAEVFYSPGYIGCCIKTVSGAPDELMRDVTTRIPMVLLERGFHLS